MAEPVLKLAPQEAHEDLEGIGSGSLAVAPYPLQDHVVAGDDVVDVVVGQHHVVGQDAYPGIEGVDGRGRR